MESYEQILKRLHSIYGEETIMIGIPEFAGLTNLSYGTVANYISKGKMLPKYFKLGNGSKSSSVRFYLEDVATYLLTLQKVEQMKDQKKYGGA